MSEPNFAGNIIVNLASLPDFLRTPILKKRMTEFFSKNDEEKAEIIVNALNAGPVTLGTPMTLDGTWTIV